MDVTTVIVVAILINKSYSQVLSLSSTCFSNGNPLTLNCETTNVTQVITFYHDGTSKGSCVPVVPVVCGPNITQSGTTTSFTISSYDDAANSGNWTCEYGPTPSPDLIITVNPCSVDNECGWCKIHCDEDIGCIFCIVLGGYFGILIIIIIVLVLCGWDLVDACMLVCCILCCIICFCKQDRKRDPESNNADGLHSESNNADGLYYQCCIRGGQYSKQNLTCLSVDGKVANKPTNDNGQQPHTGRNMEKKRPLPAIGERP